MRYQDPCAMCAEVYCKHDVDCNWNEKNFTCISKVKPERRSGNTPATHAIELKEQGKPTINLLSNIAEISRQDPGKKPKIPQGTHIDIIFLVFENVIMLYTTHII